MNWFHLLFRDSDGLISYIENGLIFCSYNLIMIMNISSNCYEAFAQPITYKLISLKVIHIIGINDLTANVYIITMNANFYHI